MIRLPYQIEISTEHNSILACSHLKKKSEVQNHFYSGQPFCFPLNLIFNSSSNIDFICNGIIRNSFYFMLSHTQKMYIAVLKKLGLP